MIPLVFLKAGKYRNEYKVIEITKKQVEQKEVVNISGMQASDYVAHGYAEYFKKNDDVTAVHAKLAVKKSKKDDKKEDVKENKE